jgi:hypothetical protein
VSKITRRDYYEAFVERANRYGPMEILSRKADETIHFHQNDRKFYNLILKEKKHFTKL